MSALIKFSGLTIKMGRWHLSAVLLGFISMGHVFAEETGQNLMSAQEVYLYAVELQEKNQDYQRAATEFGRYLSYARRHPEADYPNHEEVMHRYAQSLAKGGEYQRALTAYANFGKQYPQSKKIAQLMFEMGEIHEAQKAHQAARFRYGQLKNYAPESEWKDRASLRQAWQHLQLGEDTKALKRLNEIEDPHYKANVEKVLLALPELERLPQKDPKTAALLSALLPGAGHAYLDRPKDAQFAFLSNGLMIGATVEAFEQDMPALGVVLGVLELGWYTGTMFSASSLAHKQNNEQRQNYLEKIKK